MCLLRRHVAVDRRWQRALSPHLLFLVLLMVHLMRLCLHFGVSHPGAQVVDLAQADSREEARNLAMALARIAPRRISARVTEFGLAHRRAEQEKLATPDRLPANAKLAARNRADRTPARG